MAVRRNSDNRSTAGLGNLRRTFHTTMLIELSSAREFGNQGTKLPFNPSSGIRVLAQELTTLYFTQHKLYRISRERQPFS